MIKKYTIRYIYLGESEESVTKQCGVNAWAEVSGQDLSRKKAIELFNRDHPETKILSIRRIKK